MLWLPVIIIKQQRGITKICVYLEQKPRRQISNLLFGTQSSYTEVEM